MLGSTAVGPREPPSKTRRYFVMLRPEQILPTVIIVISFGAGIVCLFRKDWKHAVYWFAAAVLNASVTF